jgi:hypothetical protein
VKAAAALVIRPVQLGVVDARARKGTWPGARGNVNDSRALERNFFFHEAVTKRDRMSKTAGRQGHEELACTSHRFKHRLVVIYYRDV